MREVIQSKLSEISSIEAGEIEQDDVIENDVTYFGYTLQEDYINSDFEKNRTVKATIVGYLVRRKKTSENTLEIVDIACEEIISKLKDLNFKISSADINLTDNIQKKEIKGYVYFNEINNKLVI